MLSPFVGHQMDISWNLEVTFSILSSWDDGQMLFNRALGSGAWGAEIHALSYLSGCASLSPQFSLIFLLYLFSQLMLSKTPELSHFQIPRNPLLFTSDQSS